jgi:hypothetical protein
MVLRAEIDLASYDRFFPSQDFLPKAGFGNLIALPLKKKCRAFGNTEFLNLDDFELRSWPDQWSFLSQVNRLRPFQVEALIEKSLQSRLGRVIQDLYPCQSAKDTPRPNKYSVILEPL